MPVSKKRRRRKTVTQSSKSAPNVATLPGRRAIEGFMSAIGGRQSGDATAKAQDVIYEAWDQTNPRARVALARKALTISPLCADAYVLLAEEQAKSAEERLEYYRKGVEMGGQALGPKGFKEYAGHFWGFLETRPYMRARAGLAATLGALGETDAAISHYQDMPRLNPGDNQGIRYALAACLMKRGDTEALKKLLKRFEEDCSASWLYTQALIAFRENEPREEKAEELAKKACKAKSHVPAVLAGRKKAQPSTTGYLTVGGEDEADDYFEEWGFEWLTTPGAIDWLTNIAAEMATQTPRRSPH